MRNITAMAPTEPSSETHHGTLMVGRNDGSPTRFSSAGAEVDRHIEGEKEDGDELGDGVEPAEGHRAEGDGAGDPGRDGRLAGGGGPRQEGRREPVAGERLEHSRSAEGAAEGGREDGAPDPREHEPRAEDGDLDPDDPGLGELFRSHLGR